MCYAVYIGTEKRQDITAPVEGETYLYFEAIDDTNEVRKKFSKPNIYYVGSYQGCSCGFGYNTELWNEDDKDDADETDNRRSAQELVDFLKDASMTEDIEYYCCWNGDEYLPTETSREIDTTTLDLENNYFDLEEREFILFRNGVKF